MKAGLPIPVNSKPKTAIRIGASLLFYDTDMKKKYESTSLFLSHSLNIYFVGKKESKSSGLLKRET